ncbi:MAG TPA: peptidoglycan-associated lipoprotein Pal [Thermoanaerobaculia bacterium]|jgi:peptidoglycan-associated lipoprotein
MKAFALSVVIVSLALVPACRSKKQVEPQTHPDTIASATVPEVPPAPMPSNTTTVEPPHDFVQETTIKEEPLPNDIEELNRVAQQRGLIADAFFNYDESTLSADAQSALQTSASWLKKNPQYNLLVEGHCDERGTEQYNLALGDRRANTAKEYLTTLGVDASRIRTVSYGEERPFDPGHDESAWAKNRRDHLVLVGK